MFFNNKHENFFEKVQSVEQTGNEKQKSPRQMSRNQKLNQLLAKFPRGPVPDFVYTDNEEYIQRAENLCGENDYGLYALNYVIGNPEMAIEFCLDKHDYICAYQVAFAYRNRGLDTAEYDPAFYLRAAYEEGGYSQRGYIAEQFENLGLYDEAETAFERTNPVALVGFYDRQNRIEDAKRLVQNEEVSLSNVANLGRLHDWGFYDEYWRECQKLADADCVMHLDEGDITPQIFQQAWEDAGKWGGMLSWYDRAYMLQNAKRLGMNYQYYADSFKNDLIEVYRNDIWQVDINIIYESGMTQELLPYLEQYNADPADMGKLAVLNKDYDLALEYYKKSNPRDIFYASVDFAKEDKNLVENLSSLYLNKMKNEGKNPGEYDYFLNNRKAYALAATHDWEGAMSVCENEAAPAFKCDCAVVVVRELSCYTNDNTTPGCY